MKGGIFQWFCKTITQLMYESENSLQHLNAIKFTSLVKNNLSIIVRIGLIQHIKTMQKGSTPD